MAILSVVINDDENNDITFEYLPVNLKEVFQEESSPTSVFFVRPCYKEAYQRIDEIFSGNEQNLNIALSGTPGIGKSSFIIYLIWTLLHVKEKKITRIVLQTTAFVVLLDLESITTTDDPTLVKNALFTIGTLHVADGRISLMSNNRIPTLWISSPRWDNFKHFQFKEMESSHLLYLPVWNWNEIHCLLKMSSNMFNKEIIKEKFMIFGGNLRSLTKVKTTLDFLNGKIVDCSIEQVFRQALIKTYKFEHSHYLIHMVVKNLSLIGMTFASDYVAVKLWEKHEQFLLQKLKELVVSTSNDPIFYPLFERFGHAWLRRGTPRSITCRSLENDKEEEHILPHIKNTMSFDKTENILTEIKDNIYYVPSICNFDGIDSLSSLGMFQFTVSTTHSIRGVHLLSQLTNLYKTKPVPFYFIVPMEHYKDFKKQAIKSGNKIARRILNIHQYVVGIDLNVDDILSNHI